MKATLKSLRTLVGRVWRDIDRKLDRNTENRNRQVVGTRKHRYAHAARDEEYLACSQISAKPALGGIRSVFKVISPGGYRQSFSKTVVTMTAGSPSHIDVHALPKIEAGYTTYVKKCNAERLASGSKA